MRWAIVASTGGSVLDRLLGNEFFRARIALVLSDRDCGAIERAGRRGVDTAVLRERDSGRFCDRLLERLDNDGIDCVISFFTKLFRGAVLERYANRIVNLHPSLLPSFPGLHGFEDTMASGVRYAGTTIHLVDAGIDTGPVILQSIVAIDPAIDQRIIRHRIFEQQCRSLLQVVKWFEDERVRVSGRRAFVIGARYADLEYSPSLEFEEALSLVIPEPSR